MKKLTEEWLKAAKDDLDVIARIIDVLHLTHIVAFHAQQCIEKTFKALLEENEAVMPKIHNLATLHARVEELIGIEMDWQLLKTLDSLYIEARYPGELGLLPDGKPTELEAKEFNQYAIEVFEIIEKHLQRQ